MIDVIFRRVMIAFLAICLAVHIAGLLRPFSSEPTWSHLVHLLSYALCLYCVIRPMQLAWVIYTIGTIYPFLYHAPCAWTQYSEHGQLSIVCILVVVLLPAGGWLVRPSLIR